MQPRYKDTLWTDKIMQNLLRISIYKNLILSNRIFCTTPKTIRGRLLIYLSSQASKAESTVFQISFNRQELADYLNLDRSALSKELGKTILMVTHDAFTASYASRILFLQDGAIFTELRKGNDSRSAFFEKILNVLTMIGGGQSHVC